MRSTPLRLAVLSAILPALLLASGCKTTGSPFPPNADVKALTETKPRPTAAIVTEPAAEAHYNASVESWGDRLFSAGGRVCRYLKSQGMPGLDC